MSKLNKIIGILLISISSIILLASFTITKVNDYQEKIEITKKIEEKKEYFAIIEIPKINLKKELYPLGDIKNDVNKNILVHKNSIFPSKIILAAHSGSGKNAYFKNLYKLNKKDIIKIYYNNLIYEFEIVEKEEQNKTGELYLKEEFLDGLTLITCSKNPKTQDIYYSKLKRIKDI